MWPTDMEEFRTGGGKEVRNGSGVECMRGRGKRIS